MLQSLRSRSTGIVYPHRRADVDQAVIKDTLTVNRSFGKDFVKRPKRCAWRLQNDSLHLLE